METEDIDKLIEILGHIGIDHSQSCDYSIREGKVLIRKVLSMTPSEKTMLKHIHYNGPIHDMFIGDKYSLTYLVQSGLVVRVVSMAEPNYIACTEKGLAVTKIIDAMVIKPELASITL